MSLLDDTCILGKTRDLFFHGDHGEATRGEASRALGATAAEDPWGKHRVVDTHRVRKNRRRLTATV